VEKVWVKEMEATIGTVGTIKATDHKLQHVMLTFYDTELGMMQEWWYPVSVLTKPAKPITLAGPQVETLREQQKGTQQLSELLLEECKRSFVTSQKCLRVLSLVSSVTKPRWVLPPLSRFPTPRPSMLSLTMAATYLLTVVPR